MKKGGCGYSAEKVALTHEEVCEKVEKVALPARGNRECCTQREKKRGVIHISSNNNYCPVVF